MFWRAHAKRRLTFSLRWLFVLMFIVSLPLAWFGYQYRAGEQADRQFRQLGGAVSRWWGWDWRWGQAKVGHLRGASVVVDDLNRIATISTLGSLDLSRTNITDEGLRHLAGMKNLSCLDVSNTAITNRGLRHLESMGHLHFLQAHETRVTEDGVARLKRSVPDLAVYYSDTRERKETKAARAGGGS
jgi:4-amino-4-deoxy-L-arabinose transferase-like glycosyltransferase